MKSYDRNSKQGGNKGFSGFGGNRDRGRDFGGGERRNQSALFRTTCSECGDSCEVPFRPTGERPVLCNNCFRRDDKPSRGPRFENSFSDRGNDRGDRGNSFKAPGADQTQKQLAAINQKLDLILEILGEGDDDDDYEDDEE